MPILQTVGTAPKIMKKLPALYSFHVIHDYIEHLFNRANLYLEECFLGTNSVHDLQHAHSHANCHCL